MADREKVIEQLESMRDYHRSVGNNITADIANDAVELLKEQEPHVLTIDQLEDALDTVVWLDMPGAENLADGYALIMAYSHKHECMFFDSPFGDSPSQDRLEYSEYGRSWRCWDRRPLEEQRKAVKWEWLTERKL